MAGSPPPPCSDLDPVDRVPTPGAWEGSSTPPPVDVPPRASTPGAVSPGAATDGAGRPNVAADSAGPPGTAALTIVAPPSVNAPPPGDVPPSARTPGVISPGAASGTILPGAAADGAPPCISAVFVAPPCGTIPQAFMEPSAPEGLQSEVHPEFPPSRPRQMKWLPKGMDPYSACRVVVKVPAYVELPCDEYHVTENLKFIVNKDTTNWKDFLADLEAKINHGKEQELQITFIDKISGKDVRIDSDMALLKAFSQNWEIRRLQLEAIVHDLDELDNAVVPCTFSVAAPTQVETTPTNTIPTIAKEEEQVDELELLGPNYQPEYVGVDDEGLYLGGVDEDVAPDAFVIPCTDIAIVPRVAPTEDVDKDSGEGCGEEVEDDADWEGTEDDNVIIPVVLYDKKNPVMKVGTIFANIHDFRIVISQYAIKKEFEFIIAKSEPERFRARCAVEGCKWYIYAKPMMNKTTFQALANNWLTLLSCHCFHNITSRQKDC